jgi:hypothetical protein
MPRADHYNEHQFGEMHRRLGAEGGFTYDPRKKGFVTEGYSVAAHPAAELRVPEKETSTQTLAGYLAGSAPVWKAQVSKGRGQEMIGGWRSEGQDVLDIPKVFPATPTGHMKSRQAQILRGEEASWSLHENQPDPNPWHPTAGRLSAQFPEFAHMAEKRPGQAMQQPEIAAWVEKPTRVAGWEKESRIKRAQSRRA